MVAQGPPGGAPAFTGPPPPFNPNVDNVQSELIALLWIFPALSGLVVAVRIWRKRIDHTLGLGEFLLILIFSRGSSLLTWHRRCSYRDCLAAGHGSQCRLHRL